VTRRPPSSARALREQNLPRRVIGRQEAALYVGIGEKLFARLVRMGRAPQPKQISTGRSTLERWDLQQLDDFIDRLPSRGDAAGATPRRLFDF
jgi:predicted DNA-binding transcriptional regulator AlpA